MSQYFSGFVRIVEYADYLKEGKSPEYAFKLIEGQISKGTANGFGRVIDGYTKELEFGYWEDGIMVKDENGVEIDPEIIKSIKDLEFYKHEV